MFLTALTTYKDSERTRSMAKICDPVDVQRCDEPCRNLQNRDGFNSSNLLDDELGQDDDEAS